MSCLAPRNPDLADVDDRVVAAAAHHWYAGLTPHDVRLVGNRTVSLDTGRATTAVVVSASDVQRKGATCRPSCTHGSSAGSLDCLRSLSSSLGSSLSRLSRPSRLSRLSRLSCLDCLSSLDCLDCLSSLSVLGRLGSTGRGSPLKIGGFGCRAAGYQNGGEHKGEKHDLLHVKFFSLTGH